MALRENIFRAFNLSDEALRPVSSLQPDPAIIPKTEDERDAIEEYDEHFLIEFNYNTNALEGSTLTFNDTELVLEGEFPANAEDKKLEDVVAAIGVKEGCDLAKARLESGLDVDEGLIKDIHAFVALPYQPRTRGVYRVVPVYITNTQTVPANPDQVRELMADLMFAYYNSEMHPIATAAAFHAMFENIHPFRDGNGRTGRIVLNYMLQQSGYPPVAIKATSKSDYSRALEQWQVHGEPEALLNLLKENILKEQSGRHEALELTRSAVAGRQASQREPESWRAKKERLERAASNFGGQALEDMRNSLGRNE